MRCACRGDVYDISAALLKEYLYGAAHGIHRDKGIEPEYPFRLFVYALPMWDISSMTRELLMSAPGLPNSLTASSIN